MEQVNSASLPDSHVHGQKLMYKESFPALLCHVNLSSQPYKELPLSVPLIPPSKEPPDCTQASNAQPSQLENSQVAPDLEKEDKQVFLPSELPEEDFRPQKAAFSTSQMDQRSPHPFSQPIPLKLKII